jgi:hypothetical protein
MKVAAGAGSRPQEIQARTFDFFWFEFKPELFDGLQR